MAKEIPVYLFVGFLESGKTKFIQETFEDPNFDSGDKTLLLICEEGEEEYNEKKFAFPGVTVKVLEDKSELNPQNLAKLGKEADAGRVVIEYNGMWLLQDLADALPENWLVYQCIATADGTTALTYARDNSMRSLMLDKIARSELIVFNRAEAVNNDDARQELHKLVRQASRKCDIAYEFKDGSVAYDDIPDPLTFESNFAYPIRVTMAPLRQAQQRNGVPEELVKDVKIELYREGKKTGEAFVKDNYQRLCSVGIGDVPADEIRVIPESTNGAEQAVIHEIRVYAK